MCLVPQPLFYQFPSTIPLKATFKDHVTQIFPPSLIESDAWLVPVTDQESHIFPKPQYLRT